jgi:hypothetical protein
MLSEVYDIETLSNLFTYTGYCRQNQTYYQFVIHSLRNDYNLLIDHLNRDKLIMIGYNNENFDYPVIHHLLNHRDEYEYLTGHELSQKIYEKSQELINNQFNTVADYNKKIQQIDLFKIWHYDNLAKSTSLKALEIALNLPSVEDMPFDHHYWITSLKEIDEVLSYNKNDVYATNVFLDVTLGKTELANYKGKDKIQIRKDIQRKYGVNGLNFNDIKLGTELILQLYSRKFGIPAKEIRNMRTHRPRIELEDCLPKWCNFETKEFKKLVDKFKSTIVYNGELKGALTYSVIFNGIKLDYGVGGCHACIKSGVYESNNEMMILDIDADGLYPMLAITQGLYPQHLPGFLDIYDGEIVSVRMKEKHKPKKERDFVIVEGFKLAANGFYGKSNSEDSYAYDPFYSLRTTVSGQIMISMWIEKLVKNIPNLTILQVNTDGVSLLFPRKYHQIAIDVTDEMTKITGLTYEFNEYKKMVIRDVNNYSAQYSIDNKIKHKGAFEIEKELHKDPSMKIVSIALEKYFFEGVPVRQTIENHSNIYDFCLRLKLNSQFKGQYNYIDQSNGVPEKKTIELGKNTRYYISNKGGSLYKLKNENRKLTGVSVGFVTTLFNKYTEKPMRDYDINYQFYIMECNKIINQIENNQLTLF